jgi:multicomponent Na+:H+ antiporter subunit E
VARKLAIFILLFTVWLLWSGHGEPLILAFGLAGSVVGVAFAVRTRILDEEAFPLHLSQRMLTFIPWVLWQMVRSNLHLARIILSPRMPIRPHLVRFPVSQHTAIGVVIHANSVTFTPGTVTLDFREGRFMIHAIDDEASRAVRAGTFDRRISALEGDA